MGVISAGNIDREKRTIANVAILTMGEALGHDIDIDEAGLKQALAALQKRGTVRLTLDHSPNVTATIGSATDFRRDGSSIRGLLKLLKNAEADRILDIAEESPSLIGISVESAGQHAPNPRDGSRKLFRTTDIDAVSVVQRPAANPLGLFTGKTSGSRMTFGDPITRFEALVDSWRQRGAKFPFTAAVAIDPDAYNAYRHALENPGTKSSEFETAVATQLAAGAKNRGIAIQRVAKDQPDIYNAHVAAATMPRRSSSTGRSVQAIASDFEAAIQTHLSAGVKNRGQAIQLVARESPNLYNAAVAANVH